MNNEKINSKPEQAFGQNELDKIAAERHDALANERERNALERGKENINEIQNEALEQASSLYKKEQPREKQEKQTTVERQPKTRKESFDKTMAEVRSEMSAPSRAFSSFIHQPIIEKTSEVVGSTVARPNAILSGAFLAFIFTLVIYLVARYNGYPLSGTETIASFVFGWIVGLIFDYVRLLLFGKN